jgi:hypothetical protein
MVQPQPVHLPQILLRLRCRQPVVLHARGGGHLGRRLVRHRHPFLRGLLPLLEFLGIIYAD